MNLARHKIRPVMRFALYSHILISPTQQGELLGPMQNEPLGAHFIVLSSFMTVCVMEAETAVTKRLVMTTNMAVVENFIPVVRY
jgi:hypothetical protein